MTDPTPPTWCCMTRPTGEDAMSSEHVEVLWAMLRKCVYERLARKSSDREAAALAAAIEALKSAQQPPAAPPPSAPVGVERIAAEIRASLGHGATVATRRRWAIELEALAQQPASDGGFTAADMMDARQEGRKEAQQAAGFSAGDMADASAQGFRAGVESVQQPAAVDEAMVERAARAWCAGTDTPFDQLPDTGKAWCLEDMRVVLTAALAAQQGGAK